MSTADTPPFALRRRVPLGESGLQVPPLAAGSWEWGRTYPDGGRPAYGEADLREAFAASVDAGVAFFDTAEVYWGGRSEELLGRFIRESGAAVTVATKFAPQRRRFLPLHFRRALRGSLGRLGLASIDLYQTHWHTPPVPPAFWMNAMADARERGWIRAAGVSNYGRELLLRAQDLLARRGMPLATVQNQYSLTHRTPERDGVLAACRERGIAFMAWSPLGNGLLGGRYGPDTVPAGIRGTPFTGQYRAALRELYALIREIGITRGGRSTPQVALNWLLAQGVIPVHGAKSAAQARENAGALGWTLTPAELAALTEASDRLASAA